MKNLKYYLLLLISATFLVPGIVLGQDDKPTISIDKISTAPFLPGKWQARLDVYVTSTTKSTSTPLKLYVSFGTDAYPSEGQDCYHHVLRGKTCTYKCKEGETVCTYHFTSFYKTAGERLIVVWALDGKNVSSEVLERKINFPQDIAPTISPISAPAKAGVGDTVNITVSANDDLPDIGLKYLYVRYGDDLSPGMSGLSDDCSCHGNAFGEACNSAGDTKCSHTFTHKYSSVGYYTIEAWAKDWADRFTDYVTWRITIGEPTEPPPEKPQDVNDGDINIGPITIDNPLTSASFSEFIDKLISFVFTLALILFPILLIVAGIMFLTAGGDPAKVQQARKLLIYAVIGFAIIALAKLFVEMIQQVFGVKKGG